MHSHFAYGLTIHSELPLPELAAGGTEQDVVIRIGEVGFQSDEPSRIRCVQEAAEDVCLAWGRIGTARVLHGREIIVDPFPGVDHGAIRLMILGAALGVLLYQRGYLVLHASAVAIGGGVVAFIGSKGFGKSTTAALLHGRGHTVIADDIVALRLDGAGEPSVLPGFPQLKLWPDSAAAVGGDPDSLPRIRPEIEKRAYSVSSSFTRAELPLQRFFILDRGEALELQPVSPRVACLELVRNTYVPRFVESIGTNASQFRQCASVANAVPTYRLRRRNSLAALPEIARLIEENVGSVA